MSAMDPGIVGNADYLVTYCSIADFEIPGVARL